MAEQKVEELEASILNMSAKLEQVSPYSIIAENVNVSDIKSLLSRCRDFVDFMKFEIGENVTTTGGP